MTDWLDEKICCTVLWYIRKHSMDPSNWHWTRLGESHPEVLQIVDLEVGELPVVSFFRSETSWYLLTTRRVLGCYSGERVEVPVLDIVEDHFGNFKGYGGQETELMTLELTDDSEVRLEYETFKASMAPIYYMNYWKLKYPILDKLKVKP